MTDDERTWRAWKERTFDTEYMIWHDGLDTRAVTRLAGAEREQALAMLRLGLRLGDAHAGEALAAMGEGATLPELLHKLGQASGSDRVRLALAAHRLQPDAGLTRQLAEHLIDVLGSQDYWAVRIDAAIGLRHFPAGPRVAGVLLDRVAHDPDYLVRYHAANSLLELGAVAPAEISDHPAIFGDLVGSRAEPPLEEDWPRFARAAAALARLAGIAP